MSRPETFPDLIQLMKDQPPFPSDLPVKDRFIDAAIREKVRLGSATEDADLIRSILTETVEKSRRGQPALTTRHHDQRLLMVGIASAAAILAALATLLAVLPFRTGARNADEIRFLVRYADSGESPEPPRFMEAPEARQPAPFAGTIEIDVAAEPLEPGPLSLNTPERVEAPFSPSFAEVPKRQLTEERLHISAETVKEESGRRIYLGNVEVRHKEFHLFSERVELTRNGSNDSGAEVFLKAWNVTLEQTSPQRKAEAAQLDYKPNTRVFTLAGVSSLHSEKGRLGTFDPDDLVILSPNSFSIRNAPPVIKYANPAPLERNSE
ncbi:MAG: LptA/OstA family protein [Verrucomicrobiales bacterium]|nr:LptA/OstA family protein [Verrucomicrobiales bacterium]